MNTNLKSRKFWLVACGLWLVACGLAASNRVMSQENEIARQKQENPTGNLEFATAEYLYEQCKEVVHNDKFKGSYCDAFIQGFLGGNFILGLFTMSELDSETSKNFEEKLFSREDFYCLTGEVGSNLKIAKSYVAWVEGNPEEAKSTFKENDFVGFAVALSKIYSCKKTQNN